MSFSGNVDLFGLPVTEQVEAPRVKKSEDEIDRFIIESYLKEEREKEMEALKKLEEMNARIEKLMQASPKTEAKVEEPEAEPKSEKDFYSKLSDETLDQFVEGLLTALSELELTGQIPTIDNASEARDALLAVIRHLYMKKSAVAKMSRQFARFGAKRFLQKQRIAMTKAL